MRRRELSRAGWPDGAIVHDNTLDVYVARLRRKLARARTPRRDRHRARRRLPASNESALGLGLRLTADGRRQLAAASRSRRSSSASTSLLARQPPPDADKVLPSARASAALDAVDSDRGGQSRGEAPDQGAVDAQAWIYAGSACDRAAAGAAAVQAARRPLAGRPAALRGRADAPTRGCYAVPDRERRHARSARSSPRLSLEPYERTASRALIASLIFAARRRSC